jgi:hypothetical protein
MFIGFVFFYNFAALFENEKSINKILISLLEVNNLSR